MPDLDPARLSPGSFELEPEVLRARGLAACLGPGPVVLELGFGRGELLLELAKSDAARRYLGVEVSGKRVERVARRLARAGLENVRLVHARAELVIECLLPPASIVECWLNFPDPWPKRRHHRRRLVQPEAVRRLTAVLAPGAPLHLATDDLAYAGWIARVLEGEPRLENLAAPAAWRSGRPARPPTAYEAAFVAEGRAIAYFEYRRRPEP